MNNKATTGGGGTYVIAFGAGSAGQRAIGTVVFGGILSSTLMAIPFVPVFYVLLERMSERLRKTQKLSTTSFNIGESK